MAQPTEPNGGKVHLPNGEKNSTEPTEPNGGNNNWNNRNLVAKHGINPKNYYYDGTLTATLFGTLAADVNGKKRLKGEQTLAGRKRSRSNTQKAAASGSGVARYPRVLGAK